MSSLFYTGQWADPVKEAILILFCVIGRAKVRVMRRHYNLIKIFQFYTYHLHFAILALSEVHLRSPTMKRHLKEKKKEINQRKEKDKEEKGNILLIFFETLGFSGVKGRETYVRHERASKGLPKCDSASCVRKRMNERMRKRTNEPESGMSDNKCIYNIVSQSYVYNFVLREHGRGAARVKARERKATNGYGSSIEYRVGVTAVTMVPKIGGGIHGLVKNKFRGVTDKHLRHGPRFTLRYPFMRTSEVFDDE